MIWFFGLLLILIFLSLRNSDSDYLSKQNTQNIKGIFILIVFFSHYNSYVAFENNTDLFYNSLISFIGQGMVVPFLLYSGYGVMESINKKGVEYIGSIPKKRVLSVLIRFDIAVIFYIIIRLFVGGELSVKKILLSLIGWDAVGNSNWYIFAIIMLYLITYISFKLFPKKEQYHLAVIVMFVLIGVYMLAMYLFKSAHWYDTVLCYLMGVLLSIHKSKIDKIKSLKIIYRVLFLIVAALMFLVVKVNSVNIITALIVNLLFAVLVVSFTLCLKIKSKLLYWCGENLFEIYMLQRIPMIIFDKIGLLDRNIYFGFIISLISTLLLVYPFKMLCNLVIKLPYSFKKISKTS